MEGNGPARTVRRWVILAGAVATLLVGTAAFFIGAIATLFALSPGTDMGDAHVLIRTGPLYALGGVIGLLLGRWLLRASRPAFPHTVNSSVEEPSTSKAQFYDGKAVQKVLWFLHHPDLPQVLNWARLRVFDDGTADSTFCVDGVAYGFENEDYAGYILTEDEYVCLSTFDDEDEKETGIRRADVHPPDWVDPPEKPFKYLGTY